ncbi:hypothetical protein O0L34_g18482 [Tuta absoluta]|nr:hypothetical protein O0L34_g18482 [Tuta absoluta]
MSGSGGGVARSNPVNMPSARPIVPVLVHSGSTSSLEHSPSDSFRRKSLLAESGRAASVCDVQLKEDLAEAMKEDHGWREEVMRVTPEARQGVARVVDPQGTVVAPPAAPRAPPPLDADDYTRSNEDEATFRPVVRAPATLSLDSDIVVRPLPRSTTIPVQTVSPFTGMSPTDEPIPLKMDVVIPAALNPVSDWHASNVVDDQVVAKPTIVPVEDGNGKSALDSVKPDHEPDQKEEKKIEKPKMEKPAKKEESLKQEEPATKQVPVEETTLKVDPAKLDRSSSQRETREKKKDTASKIEKSVKRRDTAEKTIKKDTKLEKSFEQKDTPAKEEKSKTEAKEMTAKVEKSAKQKSEEPKLVAAKRDSRATDVDPIDSVNVDVKPTDVNKDLKREERDVRKRESAERERSSVDNAEREREYSKSLPKSNRPPADIQPVASVRIKKSPTPKSVSDKDSEVSFKEKSKRSNEPKEVETKQGKETKEAKEPKEIKKQKDVRDSRGKKDVQESSEKQKQDEFKNVVLLTDTKVGKKDDFVNIVDEPSVIATLKQPAQIETPKKKEDEIKTEEQAWDMLLNEPDKPMSLGSSQQEDKPKSKKNKKLKKTQEEQQSSKEDDSFVEIHAIEDKQESCSGDLVSISTPFEDLEPSSTYKTKKRLSKSLTPDKKEQSKSFEVLPHDEPELICLKSKSSKKYSDEVVSCPVQAKLETPKEVNAKSRKHSEGAPSEISSFWKELPKPNKSKSLSPYPELRKPEKNIDIDKDVYVINTTGEEFPEIQITRGTKVRKRSPQPEKKTTENDPVIEKPTKSWSCITVEKEPVIEKPVKSWSSITGEKDIVVEKPVKSWSSIATDKNTEKPIKSWSFLPAEKEPVIDKPAKSWSTIAAAKNTKKTDDVEKKSDKMEKDSDENPTSSNVSLQEKLFELCKRTDIMVAECDAPTELNFVEEHHSVMHDLPPLEPLDFGLDDFKLEVMRDSLLEVNDPKITSPICKINIDDILSSIKETTAKAIESSAFNLIDLERLPVKKEKGFSVIEGHKITSQEIKLDDDGKVEEKDAEIMEKSSEDDTSPVVSTDSDKEDKKNAGASNLTLPSSKQSAKSKKSRRKKK